MCLFLTSATKGALCLQIRGGPAMNREGKPVSAARIRNASADLKDIQSRV